MTEFRIRFWGVEVGVRCAIADYDDAVANLLLPIWDHQPELRPKDWFRLRLDSSGRAKVEGPEQEVPLLDVKNIVAVLERRLHMHLASNAKGAVFVHAGVVTLNDCAILFPGHSYSGKSRLTLSMTEAGAKLFSDEYAIIDEGGSIHPFPRPVSIREDGEERRIEASTLGWRDGQPAARMIAVVGTSYQPSAMWSPQCLSYGETVLELMQNAVSGRAQPRLAMTCLSNAAQGSIGWRGVRGESHQAAREIIEAVASCYLS